MECGTQFLRYYCSKHPGANCCSDEGLLLATRQKGFINQPLGFILYDVFDIYTTFFIFHYLKEKQGGKRIKDLSFARPSFKKTELALWKFFYAVFFDLVQYYNQQRTKCIFRLCSLYREALENNIPHILCFINRHTKNENTLIPSYVSLGVYFQHLEG